MKKYAMFVLFMLTIASCGNGRGGSYATSGRDCVFFIKSREGTVWSMIFLDKQSGPDCPIKRRQ